MAGACSGLRVVEFSHGMAGALAGMILGDHGADVVRIETPAGDPMISEVGSRLWNRSKQRIALDPRQSAGGEQILALARQADVVLVGLRQSAAEALGLTYENLSRQNPGVIVATITGFGWDGPSQDELAVEGMVNAIAGAMQSSQSGFRSGPIFLAARLASYGAALTCVQGILAALHVRETVGAGQHVDASLLRGLLCYRGASLLKPERHAEELPSNPPSPDPRGGRALFNLNECADGRWIAMAAFTRAFCEEGLEVLGLSHLLADPRFAGMPNTYPSDEARRAFLEILWQTFRTEPQEVWLRRMDERSVPCEPVLTVDEFRQHPQLWANDLAVTVPDPAAGPMVQPGILGHLAETPGQIRPAAAAALPATAAQEVIERWRLSAGRAAAPRAEAGAAFASGPLNGVRVLDFTAFVAGPTCTRLLADLGAEVIKVEPPEGDWYRLSSRASAMVLNRGKRGLALNLKTRESREALRRLVQQSDVVVYNYRLGVEQRLGLDYESLRRINPEIIVCRMTAFGVKGERAHRPAYDTSISALSGIYAEQAGEGNPPAAAGAADVSTGIAAATAVLLAVRAKDVTGKGQAVEATMIGAMSYVMADSFPDYAGRPPHPHLDQGQHGPGPLYRLYRTQDGGWIFLAAVQEKHWRALRQAIGRPELDSAAFASGAARRRNRAALAEALGAAFASRTAAAWLTLLKQAGVPCADPLVTLENFVEQSGAADSGVYITLDHPHYGKLREVGAPVRMSRTPSRIERPEPEVGQHTEEILRAAGFGEDEIRALQQRSAAAVPASS